MLEKAYIITKKMQLENLTAGYFMRQWTGLKLVLEANKGLIALDILASMNRRECELFDQPILQAAVFLDAGNASRLTAEQVETAKAVVVELVLRMKGLYDDTENETLPEDSSTTTTDSDSDEDFRRLKNSKEKEKAKGPAPAQAAAATGSGVARRRPVILSDSESENDAVEVEAAGESGDSQPELTPPPRGSPSLPTPSAAKRPKQMTPKEKCREKVMESISDYTSMLSSLKKTVLASKNLHDVIMKEYPGICLHNININNLF